MNNTLHLLDKLSGIGENYILRKNAPVASRPNIFLLISDQYHKENLHTAILHHLLQDPLLLKNFLTVLAQQRVNCTFKEDAKVEIYKERGWVDISLVDTNNKQAIIIENKINGAVDQPKQLLKYYNYFDNMGFEVLGTVYLTLDGRKKPLSSPGWTLNEYEKVFKTIIYLSAYRVNWPDLYHHWILPSMAGITDIDLLSTIRQYGHLLQILNKHTMDNLTLSNFYDIITENNQHFKTAQAMRQMLDDFPLFLAHKMEGEYQFATDVFPQIWVYNKSDALATVLQDCMIAENFNFTVDVTVLPNANALEVSLFERQGYLSPVNDPIQGILKLMPSNHGLIYDPERARYIRVFQFPEEKHLVDESIVSLVDAIRQIKKK